MTDFSFLSESQRARHRIPFTRSLEPISITESSGVPMASNANGAPFSSTGGTEMNNNTVDRFESSFNRLARGEGLSRFLEKEIVKSAIIPPWYELLKSMERILNKKIEEAYDTQERRLLKEYFSNNMTQSESKSKEDKTKLVLHHFKTLQAKRRALDNYLFDPTENSLEEEKNEEEKKSERGAQLLSNFKLPNNKSKKITKYYLALKKKVEAQFSLDLNILQQNSSNYSKALVSICRSLKQKEQKIKKINQELKELQNWVKKLPPSIEKSLDKDKLAKKLKQSVDSIFQKTKFKELVKQYSRDKNKLFLLLTYTNNPFQDISQCPVCRDNTADHINTPCGHVICRECSMRINNRCHMCRSHCKPIKIHWS